VREAESWEGQQPITLLSRAMAYFKKEKRDKKYIMILTVEFTFNDKIVFSIHCSSYITVKWALQRL
jgi:acetone carboxylase gamma subunit